MPHASCLHAPQLAYYRQQRGWSRTQLAQRSGVTLATISRIEGGHSAQQRTLATLARALSVDTSALTARIPPPRRTLGSAIATPAPAPAPRYPPSHPPLVTPMRRRLWIVGGAEHQTAQARLAEQAQARASRRRPLDERGYLASLPADDRRALILDTLNLLDKRQREQQAAYAAALVAAGRARAVNDPAHHYELQRLSQRLAATLERIGELRALAGLPPLSRPHPPLPSA